MRFLEELIPKNFSANLSFSAHENHGTDVSWKILWIIVTLSLIIFTVTGNAITLYAVCKIKSFQSSISNLYISSLAAADIIVGGFVMTFMMLYTIAFDGKWVFGRLMCDVWQAVDFISCTISLYSICAIGFDRWLNLEKPLRIFKRNKIVAKKAIVIVWLLPVLLWAPILTIVRSFNEDVSARRYDDEHKRCSFPWRPKFLIPLVAMVTFYLPVFTLIVLFVRITAVIRSHFAFLHQHSNQNLLEAENKSNNNCGRYSSAEKSPSVTPLPERRPRNNPGATGGSPRGRSVPPKLSIIPQDDSSKDNNPTPGYSDYPYLTPTPSEMSPRLSVIPSPSPSALNTPNSGNQSPLAVMLLRERMSPAAKDGAPHFVLPVPPSPGGYSLSPEASPVRRRSSGRSGRFFTEMSPLLSPRLMSRRGSADRRDSADYKRSASRDSMDEEKSDKSASPVDPGDQKRSSVTSDTAVFFTKRVLARKPQLQRAQTDLFIEVPLAIPHSSLNTRNGRTHMRRGTRFSVVSLTTSLTNLGRRCSLNIFSELLPCPASFSQQIRAAKAVGLIMIFFLVCWIPFLILWPLKAYCNECVPDNVYNLAIWANYLNSSLNPILYTLCSPRFQNYFKDSCKKCKCCIPKAKNCTKTLML